MTVRPFHDDEAPRVLDEIVRIAGGDRAALARRTGIATGIALIAASRGIPVPEGLVEDLARRETEERLVALVAGIDGLRGGLPGWLAANGVAVPAEGGTGHVPHG